MSQSDTSKPTIDKKSDAEKTNSASGSRSRMFFMLIMGVCVLLWLVPLIIAHTTLRNSILPMVVKNYPGDISVSSMSMSWSQPVVFHNVVFKDFDGREILRIDRIATQKTLWGLATDRKHVGDVNLDGVTSLTYLDEHGLANQDFITAMMNKGTKEHPEGDPDAKEEPPKTGPQQSLTLHITDLNLCVVNGEEEETPYLTGMEVTVTRPEQRTEPVIVKGAWKEPESETVKADHAAKIAFAVSLASNKEPEQLRSGAFKFKTESFDLKQLTPLISAVSPGATLDGISSSEMEIKWSGPKESPRFAVKGNWEAAPFQLTAPALIGEDEIHCDSASGEIDLMSANGVLYFKQAEMKSPFGDLSLQGNLNWDDLKDEDKREKLAGLLNSRLKLSGKLDLAEAARQLPETFHLKPGMKITGGTVDFQVSNFDPDKPEQPAGEDTVWLVGLKTSDLTGVNEGRDIRWEQPVSMLMKIARTPDSFDIQSLRCTSDFLTLTGSGNPRNLTIELKANLDQLSKRLEQFVDLQEIALKGKMEGKITFQVNDQNWETLSFLSFENLELAVPDRRGWQEPALKLTVEGAGTSNETQIHADRFIVTLIAGDDAFQAKLDQPTTINRKRDETAKPELLPFKIQLKGKLASWADRVRPLSRPDLQLDGDVQFASSVSIGDQYVAHENTTLDLTNVRVITPTLWINEPRAEIKTAGSWDELNKTLKASDFTYRGSALVVTGEKMEVQFPHDDIHTTSLVGSLAYKCDLHTFSQWFQNPAEPPAQKYYGLVAGSANVIVSEESRLAKWESKITDFAIEAPIKTAANPDKPVVPSKRNPGWAISWQEPEILIEGDALQDLKSDLVTLNRMSVQSEMLDLSAKGEIRDFSTTRDVRLAGEVTYDWENLTPLLRSKLGPDVEIVGHETRPFSLTGPLGTAHAEQMREEVLKVQPRPLIPNTRPLFVPTDRYRDLKGEAGIGWEKANIRGLTSGKTTIEAHIKDGRINITPLDLNVSGGRLRIAPIVRLDVKPAALVFEQGDVIDNFQFTPEMTRNSLRFVAPMIANSTNIQGQFSLSQDYAIIPIDEPKLGEARGALMVKSARVKPGPLFDALAEKIDQVLAIVNINRSSRLIGPDSVFLQVDNQEVQYHMIDGRVYHSPFEVQMKGITVRTTGSVGLDESLDLVAEVGFANMVSVDQDRPILKSLVSRPLKLPIGGTLKKPKVDMSQVGNYAKQMGVNALDAVLGGGVGQQLQSLFPERTPEEMERIQKEREERRKEREKRREERRLEKLKRKQGL